MNAVTAREIALSVAAKNLKDEDFIYQRHKEEVIDSLMDRIELDAKQGGFGKYFRLYPNGSFCRPYVTYYRQFHRRLVKDLRMILLARGFRVSHWPWILNCSDATIWIGW